MDKDQLNDKKVFNIDQIKVAQAKTKSGADFPMRCSLKQYSPIEFIAYSKYHISFLI